MKKISFQHIVLTLFFALGLATYSPTNFAYNPEHHHHHHHNHDYTKHETKPLVATPHGDVFMKIVILNTGDIHEHLSHFDAIKNYISKERSDTHLKKDVLGKHVIVTDAGDMFCAPSGKNCNDHLGGDGEEMAKKMSQIHYDAMAIGNHDLAYGTSQLNKLASQYNLPIYSANLSHAPQQLSVQSHRLFSYTAHKGGKNYHLTVGVIGTMCPSPDEYHLKKDIDKKSDLKMSKVNSGTVQGWISQYFGKRPDIVVLITHQEDDLDKAINGVTVVVGGHSHRRISEFVNGKMLVKAGKFGEDVGRTVIYWNLGKNKLSGKITTKLARM